MATVTKRIRRRLNVERSVKGVHTPDLTVEVETITEGPDGHAYQYNRQEDSAEALEIFDGLWAELIARHPAPAGE